MSEESLKEQLKKRKVLVTDDQAGVLELLSSLIESWGYEVVVLESKVEAVRKLEEIKPDLVTTDIGSPGMDGFEFIRLVKEFDSSIPVIVISGNLLANYDINGEMARKAVRLGAFDCLKKPFDVIHLRQAIERALKTRSGE